MLVLVKGQDQELVGMVERKFTPFRERWDIFVVKAGSKSLSFRGISGNDGVMYLYYLQQIS